MRITESSNGRTLVAKFLRAARITMNCYRNFFGYFLGLSFVCTLFLMACSDVSQPPIDLDPIVVPYDRNDTALADMLGNLIADVETDLGSGLARGRLGMAYEINDFKRAAADTYAQAARLDETEFKWPYFRSQLHAEFGDIEQALKTLNTAIEIDAEYPPVWLWRGKWLRNLGRFDESIVAYERARDLEAGAIAEIGIGQTLLSQRRDEDALAILKPIIDYGHPHIYRLIGQAHQALGNLDAAKINLARGKRSSPALWRDPRHSDKWQFLASYGGRLVHAEQLLKSGEFEEVVTVLEPMHSTNSADEAVIANLAMAYGRLNKIDQAIELIEEGFKFRPGYFRFHNVLASIHYQSGKPKLALKHLADSVDTSPTQTWPYQQQATIYTNQGEFDRAISAYDKALSYGIENPELIHHQVGMIEGARENWDAAIERFQKAVARDAAYTMAYIYLSRTLAEVGNFEQAREALDWADLLRTHRPQRLDARRRLIDLENDARSMVTDS